MRLTVHVENAIKKIVEVSTKEGTKKVEKTMNTLTFADIKSKDEVVVILKNIKEDELGTPTKHYLTEEKIPGRSFVRRKKK